MTEHVNTDEADPTVDSFAAKLDAFAAELPDAERNLLHRLIERAASVTDDTAGHGISIEHRPQYRSFILVNSRPSPLFLQALQFNRGRA